MMDYDDTITTIIKTNKNWKKINSLKKYYFNAKINFKRKINNYMIQINLHDKLCFECNPDVLCFNICCQNLNQVITPYDILRLKNYLNLSSKDFLKKYTDMHIGPESALPMLTLKTKSALDLRCTFVTHSGCSVYSSRPASCRMYPIARVVSKSRETGALKEKFFLIKEKHCLGFNSKKEQSISQWLLSQELFVYNKMNDLLLDIIALINMNPNFKPGNIIKDIYTAFYDLDSFKDILIEKDIGKRLKLDMHTIESILKDDVLLLKTGIDWVKLLLLSI